MAACQQFRTWITQNVLIPVTEFITQAQEKCEEVRQWIEEQVSRPVEQWVSQQETRCRELPWWNPLRWFCEIVTILVKVVVWVTITSGKWMITVTCQTITIIVGIIVTFVLRVTAWLFSFVVCLFTDMLEALKSFRDLWVIILDTIGSILNFVQTLLDDVDGILGDLEEIIDSLATSLGWLGVVLGIVKGIIRLVRDVVSVVKDIVGAVKDIALGVFGLSLCRILRGLTNLGTSLGRIVLATGFSPIALLLGSLPLAGSLLGARVIGYLVAGIRDTMDLHQLERIITAAINNTLGAGSVRATRALETIGIGAYPMGLPFHADARRLFLSSNNRELDLRELHSSGVINLYALAGYFSDCRGVINEPEGEVVYAGTDLHVSYADLVTFLQNGPGSVPEFHVFSITRAKFRSHLEIARRKAAVLGIQLFFQRIGTLQAMSLRHIPLDVDEVTPPGDVVQQQLFQRMGRTGVNDNLSRVPIISHFHYVSRDVRGTLKELFGLASLLRPSCHKEREVIISSGVTYRNRSPDWAFRWVLAHELGHYWGLNHRWNIDFDYCRDEDQDRSLDEIMYAPSTGIGLTITALLEYLFLGGEPRFTLGDARTVWKWITKDGAASLLPR